MRTPGSWPQHRPLAHRCSSPATSECRAGIRVTACASFRRVRHGSRWSWDAPELRDGWRRRRHGVPLIVDHRPPSFQQSADLRKVGPGEPGDEANEQGCTKRQQACGTRSRAPIVFSGRLARSPSSATTCRSSHECCSSVGCALLRPAHVYSRTMTSDVLRQQLVHEWSDCAAIPQGGSLRANLATHEPSNGHPRAVPRRTEQNALLSIPRDRVRDLGGAFGATSLGGWSLDCAMPAQPPYCRSCAAPWRHSGVLLVPCRRLGGLRPLPCVVRGTRPIDMGHGLATRTRGSSTEALGNVLLGAVRQRYSWTLPWCLWR